VCVASATASAHVVTYRRKAGRALSAVGGTRRLLEGTREASFAVVGRASGGMGSRHVNRTLSLRRTVVLVDWVDTDAAEWGRATLESYWQDCGAEVWSAGLMPLRSKGQWRKAPHFVPTARAAASSEPSGLIASVTYAHIRPSKMAHFYLRGFPGAARRLTGPSSPMLAGVGFGDIPLRNACTFSVWPSSRDLDRIVLARSEPHATAIRRSNDEDWLSESLFARFLITDHGGTWGSDDPLASQRA
jgi:hypothetical protein